MILLDGLDAARAEANGAGEDQAEALRYYWEKVRAHFGDDFDAADLTFAAVENYIAARRIDKAKGQSIRREVQSMRRALRQAEINGLMSSSLKVWPTVRSDPANEAQKGKLHPLPVIIKWLKALHEDSRDECLFALLTGLRAREIKRVSKSWVEAAPEGTGVAALLRVPAGSAKNRRERVVGLTEQAYEILKRQHAKHGDPVFAAVSHRKNRETACTAIGYAKVITLRDLRHTFATLGVQLTGDAVGAQGALGHSSLAVTQRYQTATIERVAAVSTAVGEALSRHRESDQVAKNALYGGRRGSRTPDPLRVKQVAQAQEHVIACEFCLGLVLGCTENAHFAGDVGTVGPDQVEAVQ